MKYKIFTGWAIAIICVWLFSGILVDGIWGETNRGTIGDMFGAINALFSGLAFAGIIYTIVIQREELKLQREELKLQREEIARSREELAGQKESMNLQRFETTLFNMFSAHQDIVSSVKFGNELQGVAAFQNIYNGSYMHNDPASKVEGFCYHVRNFELCYDNFIFILKYILDEPLLTEEQKLKYASIFVAQLSKAQIFTLYFWAISKLNNGELTYQNHLILMSTFGIAKMFKSEAP